jgi:hypothetical protein
MRYALLAMLLASLPGSCQGQAPAGQQPAVLFAGTGGGYCAFEVARKLNAAGFALRGMPYPGLEEQPLTWDQAKSCNVLVLSGLGRANADMTLPARTEQTIATLQRFLESGGGILWFSTFGQMATDKPPQDAFLNPLGLTPLFAELPADPETEVVGTAWKIPFAHTEGITPSPATEGVTSLWYPTPHMRVGGQNHTISFTGDANWTVLVKGSRSSVLKAGALQALAPTDPGTYQSEVPIAGSRELGKGRIVYLGITPEYLIGGNALTTLEGIVLERGLRNVPSGGYKLLESALKWLAEPSLQGGEVGGATMDAAMLEDPHKTRFGTPWDWSQGVSYPGAEPAYRGQIGARTRYSTGKATVPEWVAAAKAQGLSFLVFLEEFAELSSDEFAKLKADCVAASSREFTALPGFTIDDEVGNRYFYFGPTFPYPDPKFLSKDGKVLVSRDPEIGPKDPYVAGQLAMTTLDYAYSIGSFKLTAGNYLLSRDASPFANWFSNWDAVGVITSVNGGPVEDATNDYLELVDFGNGPTPLAIGLMDDPAALAKTRWTMVLRLPENGGQTIAGALGADTKISDYFDHWNFYPDNPAKPYVTSGPEIESWCYTGQRDYGGDNPGDFVWENYRWPLRGRVTSEPGLQEVTVYDGTTVFRRYLPGGAKELGFTLDLNHDRQHNLVIVAADTAGGRAVSGEQWDRNHRLEEFMCSDRNNQLSYGYLTNRDGIGLLLGGNQTLATPNKRVAPSITPAGTFKNDSLLGAPAFDGAAGGEPDMIEQVLTHSEGREVRAPSVSESHRLFHTGDVHIGEGRFEHNFADGVGVYNVWHTLWRTEPATDFTMTRRSHFFQVNPDSPLAVFLWQWDIRLLRDMPNDGFWVAFLRPAESRLWSLRSSVGESYAGLWEDTLLSSGRSLTVPFGPGACAAFLDSPLGGVAMFPLTDGLEADLALPGRSNLLARLSAAASPQKAGEIGRVELLFVGIPRATSFTKQLPSSSTEVVERFYHQFGLDGQKGGYTVVAQAGSVSGQRYILDVDGSADQCFSGQLNGQLVSSLPIRVSGLSDRWSAYFLDRGLSKARPIGVFEGRAWATVCPAGSLDLFVGHPLIADNADVCLQLTQTGADAWRAEYHNPTDKPLRVTVRKNAHFDLLKAKPFTEETVDLPAGSSVWRDL